MNKGEKLDEPELDKLFEELRQPNHQDIGRIAVDTPPTYFSPTQGSFGWDDMGTYLEGETKWEGSE